MRAPTFFKAEYLLNPRQAVRRVVHAVRPAAPTQVVRLPWGAELEVNVTETIGRSIWNLGLYELLVSELLWRLTNPGAVAVNLGANLGHMASIFAARGAQVLAFEPHPRLRALLERNVARWINARNVHVRAEAIGEATRQGWLDLPAGDNDGVAHLADAGIPVEVTTLVAACGDLRPNIVKMDVEGAEPLVLRGAGGLLGSIRDWVYEDHLPQPSEVGTAFERAGYTVFRVCRGLLSLRLTRDLGGERSSWEPPVFVATRDEARLHARLRMPGWKVLHPRRPH